jgi:hypothetical protein
MIIRDADRQDFAAGKMGAKCIGYGVLLANQEMPRAVEPSSSSAALGS